MITAHPKWLEACERMSFRPRWSAMISVGDNAERYHVYWGDGTMMETTTREVANRFAFCRHIEKSIND